jgi:hypothetical protein
LWGKRKPGGIRKKQEEGQHKSGLRGNNCLIKRVQEIRKDDKMECSNKMKQKPIANRHRFRLTSHALRKNLCRTIQFALDDFVMAILKHEVWIDPEGLTGVCLAGKMGDAARSLYKPGSRPLTTIEASSHFDVMTKYYAMMGWGEYSTEHEWDYQPYPEEWLEIQMNSGLNEQHQ